MELLALGKPIKKPPRSDERDGELFCGTPTFTVLTSFLNAKTYTVTSRHKALIVMGHHWMDSSQGGISCTNATEIVELAWYEYGVSTGLFYSIFTNFTSDTVTVSYSTTQTNTRLTIIAVD